MPDTTSRSMLLPFLLIGLGACGPTDGAYPPPVEDRDRVHVDSIEPRAASTAPPSYVGVVSPSRAIDLASKAGGILQTVAVDVGARVDAGETVAELDDRDERQEIGLGRARKKALAAAVEESLVDLSRARSGLNVAKDLAGGGYLSTEEAKQARFDVQRSSAARDRASAELAASQESLELLARRVEQMRVVAPWDAVVVRRYHEPGEFVAPGAPIIQLLRRGPTRIRFAIPPNEVDDLNHGSEVHCETPGGAPVRAQVRSIAPSVDPFLGLVVVEAEVSDPPRSFRPGAPVVVRLAGESE